MPIQSVSGLGNSAVAADFFAAAQSRITSEIAARGDGVLQTRDNTPEVHDTTVGVARAPVSFSGSLVDLRA